MLKLNCELVAGKSFSISSTAAAYNHERMPVDIVDELCLRFWILAASEAIIAADAMRARLAFYTAICAKHICNVKFSRS